MVKKVAHSLNLRILHFPITRLLLAAEEQSDELLKVANRLFEPEDEK